MHFSSLNPPSLFSVSLCKHDLVTMSVWATVLQSEFEFITALFLEVWKFPTHPNRAWPSLACLCNTRRFARFKLLIKHFYAPAHIGAKFVFGADHKTLVGHHSNTSLFVFLDARFFRAPFCRPKMHYMCECPCIRKIKYVSLEHKSSLQSLGYICRNSQQYTVWVKIIDFSFMPKFIRILRSCFMNIFSKFLTVNISKLNFWLVTYFIWTTLTCFFAPCINGNIIYSAISEHVPLWLGLWSRVTCIKTTRYILHVARCKRSQVHTGVLAEWKPHLFPFGCSEQRVYCLINWNLKVCLHSVF